MIPFVPDHEDKQSLVTLHSLLVHFIPTADCIAETGVSAHDSLVTDYQYFLVQTEFALQPAASLLLGTYVVRPPHHVPHGDWRWPHPTVTVVTLNAHSHERQGPIAQPVCH